jgi:hypothetical protein
VRYVYEHDGAGLGEATAGPDLVPLMYRDAGDGPAATMAELDMPHGTEVELAEVRDADHDLEIVSWTDRFGTPRRTSVQPAFFRDHFREVG